MKTQIPYIDIHTHQPDPLLDGSIVSIRNIALNQHEAIPAEQRCSIGLHPWYIDGHTAASLQQLRSGLKQAAVVAVGECGLDKNIAVPFLEQQAVFEQQIQLADEFQKPLIIHCVRAFQEVLTTLSKSQFTLPVIFHGYRKNWILAQQLIGKGYYLSIGAHCLDGSQDEILKNMPLEQLFLETDTHTAIQIERIYQYVASVKSIPLAQLMQAVYDNYRRVFAD